MNNQLRELRLVLYFLIGFLLAGVVGLTYAAPTTDIHVDATQAYAVKAPGYSWNGGCLAMTPQGTADCITHTAPAYWTAGSCSGTIPNQTCVATRSTGGSATIYQGCFVGLGLGPWNASAGGCKDAALSYTCPTGQNWTLTGASCDRPACASGLVRDPATGVCPAAPTCTGNQHNDPITSLCVCDQTQPTTVSYQVGAGGKKDAPACNNGCSMSSAGAWGSPVIACHYNLSGMFNPKTLTSTCYARSGQTGTTCSSAASGTGEPIQITLQPATAPPAPAGTDQNGAVDPLSTADNNADPITCANSGGNYGVFNGAGHCYKPSATDPVITVKDAQTKVTDPTGKESTTTTTVTQTCTGVGACTSSTTTSNTTGGSVTSSGGTGAATLTKTGDGQYKLDLPTDYQRDSTGLMLNAKADDLLERLGKTTTDDSPITGAKQSAESDQHLKDEELKFTNAATGDVDPSSASKGAWDTAMRDWIEPIPMAGCTPISSNFAGHAWELNHCPVAAQISEWGAYALYVLTAFGLFVMFTGGKDQG